MKVLLIKDVYKLGRAGDVKKVADGYGRNFLLPNKMAVLASAGALKQVEAIRSKANANRDALNSEMSGISAKIDGITLVFTSKAGETGKLYGSITAQMVAELLSQKIGSTVDRRHVDCQPIRTLGEHKAVVRLTVDLNPEVTVMVYREGEAAAAEATAPAVKETPAVEETPTAEAPAEA